MIYATITARKRHEDLARHLEGTEAGRMSPWPPPREDPNACQSCLARGPIARAPFTVIRGHAAGVAVWVCQPCAEATVQGNQP